MRVLVFSLPGEAAADDAEPADWTTRDRGTGVVVAGTGVPRRRSGEGLPELVARVAPDEVRLPGAGRWTDGVAAVLAALLPPALATGSTVRVGADAFRPDVAFDARILRLVAEGLSSHSRATDGTSPAARRRFAEISASADPTSSTPPSSSRTTSRTGHAHPAPQRVPATSGTPVEEQGELPVGLQAQAQRDAGGELVRGEGQSPGTPTTSAAGPGSDPRTSGESSLHRPLTAGKRRTVQGRFPGKGVRGGT
ncbi:MAG: hypothetical protein AB7I24_16320 [Candidatus Nanopelagicales bacterium]